MKRVQIQIRDEQLLALQARAAADERSLSSLVRDAVDGWIAGDERRRMFDRALSTIGIGNSGLGDVSENHDEYFAEAIEARLRR